MFPTNVKAILAVTLEGGFSKNGTLPWHIPEEMAFFKEMTLNQVVVMGYKTFESMNNKELKNRINYVLNESDVNFQVIKIAKKHPDKIIWVIGGNKTFYKTFNILNEIYISIVTQNYDFDMKCESMIPLLEYVKSIYYYNPTIESKDSSLCGLYAVPYNKKHPDKFVTYKCGKMNMHEYQLTEIMKKICKQDTRIDRTMIGTKSIFGMHIKFDLNESFPLSTIRPGYFKGIFYELQWFLRGQTDNEILQKNGVHIWDGNSSREYLDKYNLNHLKVNDCGPIYGFQWRHWGAKYIDCKTDYKEQGIDQINILLNEIKNNPGSRRLIINGWNVSDLQQMSLPPCHTMYQFYIDSNKLSCHLYQRSSDVMLAGHWNISSAALMCYLITATCKLDLGQLFVSYGDSHIYTNHMEHYNNLIMRNPAPYPVLKVLNIKEKLELYEYEDIVLSDYRTYPKIDLVMNQ